MPGMLLLSIFIITAILQTIYWGVIFFRFALHHPKETNTGNARGFPISVVICAYNEEENLRKHLPAILAQEYPNFEVLIVNDDSTDGSGAVIEEFQQSFPHLRSIRLDYPEGKKTKGKKNALSEGIKNSSYETILVTDADCHPASEQWIQTMASHIEVPKTIGLGYAPYEFRKGFLNVFIRFETIYTAIQYMSFALWGSPYMGVGRNMIYKKELFYKVGGFKSHEHVASGDDDLFVNAIANRSNTGIVIQEGSFMYSPPMGTWGEYYRQKSRHMTTGRHYKPLHQILLGLLSLSHFGFYILAGLLWLSGISTIFASVVFLATILLKTTVFSIIALRLNERRIIPYFLLLDVIYILYYVILAPALAWGKTDRWK